MKTTTKSKWAMPLAAAAIAALPFAAKAGNCYWEPEHGNRNIADITNSANWRGGVMPTSSDVVRVSSTKMEVTDDNAAYFSTFYELVLSSSTVTLNVSTNVTFAGGFQGSKSRVIKVNDGVFTCTGSRETYPMQLLGGEFVVSNGVFVMEAYLYEPSPSVFKVYKPGVLSFGVTRSHTIAGLVGDGTVSNAVAANSGVGQIYFVGERLAEYSSGYVLTRPPYVFSGDFVGTVSLTAGKTIYEGGTTGRGNLDYGTGGQFFDVVSATNLPVSVPRFNAGTFGVKAFGSNADKTHPSTFGNYDSPSFFCDCTKPVDAGFVYIGDGETTDRNFDLYFKQVGSRIIFDAGAHGGLDFTGHWYDNASMSSLGSPDRAAGTSHRLVLTGSNAVPCVVNGRIYDRCPTNSLAIFKQGTGTWRLNSNDIRNAKGIVAVEKGRLEFDSIADVGVVSALGIATMLSTNWSGAADAPFVNYAYALGDGSTAIDATTATMAYVGAGNSSSTNRPFAVKGAGRVTCGDGAGKLRLCGAFSAQEGVNALVLGGAGTDNCFRDVTNGVGTLKVVKEGAGKWHLSGDVKLGGGVEVNEGTLRISNRYTWYRLNLRENWGAYEDVSTSYGFRAFGMWDADGHLMPLDLTAKYDAYRDPRCVETNSTAFANPNGAVYGNSSRTWATAGVTYADGTASDEQNPSAGGGGLMRMSKPVLKADDPSTWARFVMRYADDAKPAVCYDFKAEEMWSHDNHRMEMKSYSMDASADGLVWTTVHERDDDNTWVTAGYWHSNGAKTRTKDGGFRLSATRGANEIEIASVAVASGATLDVEQDANVVVAGISYDTAKGGGTVKGVSLAADGTVSVVGEVADEGRTVLSMDLSAVGGVANANGWRVEVNGVAKPAWRARASASGLTVAPPGTVLIVR